MNLGAALRAPIATIDALRGRTLRIIGPLAPGLLRDRELRVAAYGLVAIGVALGVTFAAPMLLLAAGPLVLGVPHLVADLRYLVARPGLHRRLDVWLAVGAPALASFFVPHAWVAASGVVSAAAVARAPVARRVAVGAVGLAVVAVAYRSGWVADLLLAHAHNLIAIALLVVWSRGRSRSPLLVALAFVLGAVAILLGAFDRGPSLRLSGSGLLDSASVASTLAPVSDPVLSLRLVLLFAFAQSVHYAVWVRLVPEVDRPRPGLRSFSSSARALVADLGLPLVVLAGLAALGLAVWGCVALAAARDGYLRLAIFHGPLELGAATVLLLERGRIGAPGDGGPGRVSGDRASAC